MESPWPATAELLEAVGDAVCGLDPLNRVAWLNRAAKRGLEALGGRLTGVYGRSLENVLPFPLEPNLAACIDEARRTGLRTTCEVRVPRTERRIRVRAVPLPFGVALVFRERTDERALNRLQAAYEARYRRLFDRVPLPLVVYERKSGIILAVNAIGLEALSDGTPHLGAAITSWIHPEDRERFLALAASEERVERGSGLWRVRRSDGEFMEADVTSLDLEFDGFSARIAIVRDVTEERRVERERSLLRSAIGRINDLLVVSEVNPIELEPPKIVFVNEAFESHTGWMMDEVVGQPIVLLAGPETDLAEIDRVHSGMRRGETVRAEVQHYTREGRSYWVELVVAPVLNADGVHTHWVEVHRDISERKALEEQLFQSQKMEAVGRLAGGVAHDFNNVLTAISGFSELLLEELPAGGQSHEEVVQIHAAAARATGLTRQLLAFSRKQIMRPRPVNVGALVQGMEPLIARVATEAVSIQLSIADQTPLVMADQIQLEQVLLNLAVNGCEAMDDGGELTIEVSEVALDGDYIERHYGVQPGHYVCLIVSDSGSGMDRATRERIFEPFFTTKSGGTGLGLSTVYGIIRQSGGHVWVYSEIGVGSTFKVYLPVATEVPVEELPEREVVPTLGGRETVLVVEDEELVRMVTRAMLLRRGYTVLLAEDGEQALRVASSHLGPIDLLLTDVVMPRANGRRVAEQLLLIRPSTRVLYMSGYTEDAIVHHGVLDSGINLLEKPFTEQDLARAVREALDVSDAVLA